MTPMCLPSVGEGHDTSALPLMELCDDVDARVPAVLRRVVGTERRLPMVADHHEIDLGTQDEFQQVKVVAGHVLNLINEDRVKSIFEPSDNGPGGLRVAIDDEAGDLVGINLRSV